MRSNKASASFRTCVALRASLATFKKAMGNCFSSVVLQVRHISWLIVQVIFGAVLSASIGARARSVGQLTSELLLLPK